MIVADTNLIASLFLPTSATRTAEAVLEKDPDWTAPTLWRYEFKNVLATQVRFMGLPVDQAVAVFDEAGGVILEPEIEVEPRTILRLAEAQKLTAYDAEFLALALALGLKIVTLDRAVLRAAPNFAMSPDAFIDV